MKFRPLPKVFPDQDIWGAAKGAFTFVITRDSEGYTASAKIVGATPFDDTKHDLIGGYGAHATWAAAENACKDFYRNRQG
jgi:hypothetical protein